jgi:hypothetical protein
VWSGGPNCMPDRGNDLGVDLHELWLAGKQYLPEVAEQFNGALAHTRRAADYDFAFHRSAAFGGGGNGPAFGPFTALRDQLSDVYVETWRVLSDAAIALIIAANTYAETDDAAKRKFESLRGPWGGPS